MRIKSRPPDLQMTNKLRELRAAVDTTVGQVFYGTLLKQMRSSSLKGTYGHGGRGEEVFQAQLHQVLADRAGQARSYSLNEAIYQRLAGAQSRRMQETTQKDSTQ